MKVNKIYQGDAVQVLKTFPDEFVDCVITSPPYNLGINYEIYKDNLSWDEYFVWCALWIKEIYRVLKSDGRFLLNHYLSCGTAVERRAPLMELNEIAQKIGFGHHGLAVWYDITLVKRTAWGSWLSASAPYLNSPFEGVLVLFKNKWKKDTTGESDITKDEFMEIASGVWKIAPEHNRDFPTAFPEKLVRYCIKFFTFKNEIILDPFMGSGTTAVVAKKLGRNWIGIELNPNYVKMANKRLNAISYLLFNSF